MSLLNTVLDELLTAGAEEAGNTLMPAALGATVGAAVGAGITYVVLRRSRTTTPDVQHIMGELKLDRAALSAELLADVLDAQLHACGVPARVALVKALATVREKHGVATVNVVLYVLASTVAYDRVVGAKPTDEHLLTLAAATLSPLDGVDAVEGLPSDLLKSDDARDKALVAALKLCFGAKQKIVAPKPAATAAA